MQIDRSSGILLHISSLPGRYGIGTMGKEASDFIDFLVKAKMEYWQVLPTGPVSSSMCYSPYSSTSAFAGNSLLINIDDVMNEEWFRDRSDIELHVHDDDFVNFQEVENTNNEVLRRAYWSFRKFAGAEDLSEFVSFREENSFWLNDYACYEVLARNFSNYEWTSWESPFAHRNDTAITALMSDYSREIEEIEFIQFIFLRQWTRMKDEANRKGIKIIGDIPIYMSMNSADAWSMKHILQIDRETLKPSAVAGVPPDYFSATGQLWGNPLYRWEKKGRLNQETIDWWLKRIAVMLEFADFIRIDHFRGIESYWSVDAGQDTAIYGKWIKGPGKEFFEAVSKEFGNIPLLAEDLGIITDEVKELRDTYELPGMKILQFAFDHNNENEYLPHNIDNPNCILYTGTHDNDTTNGWFYGQDLSEDDRKYIMEYMGIEDWSGFHWKLIRTAMSSRANLVMIPAQDILGYGREFRMNKPSTIDNNWTWKLRNGAINSEIADKLKRMNHIYRRESLKEKVES